jgi:pimeloyl-ACP methyl ester carboxylesterase
MRTVREIAMVYQWLANDQRLQGLTAVGLGFGGWIAAEMAVMCHHLFAHLVLAGAMGLKPRTGEILDQFLIDTISYVRSGFADRRNCEALYGAEPTLDQLEQWEINREMTSRVAYKPYMFDQGLPHLLGGIRTPTLVVWGKENGVVPAVCGEQYREAIAGARMDTLAGCGHFAEVEKPAELAKLVRDFASGR